MRLENKYELLERAFRKAKEEALKAFQENDGGTCNFDCPTINYKAMRYAKPKVIETLAKVGLTGWEPTDKAWKGILLIEGATFGQGFCRTAMAEAFSESLKSNEIESGVYYQMD